VSAGVAIHSLRAAAPASITSLRDMARTFDGPIHIHVSEQQAEVEDCMAAMGVRPIEWLAREGLLDSRWQLVHATHATPGEIEAVAKSGAAIVLCPSTEANLGDGLTDLSGWLGAGVPMTIGSDSHVTRDWREELRLADYGQRLALRRRNVAAAGGGISVNRRAPVRACGGGKRRGCGRARLGPRGRRTRRRPAGGRNAGAAARHSTGAAPRSARILEPRPGVARRHGRGRMGHPRRQARGRRRHRGAIPVGDVRDLGRPPGLIRVLAPRRAG
jgi:hypothetical protein